jgi:hypothetical protein
VSRCGETPVAIGIAATWPTGYREFMHKKGERAAQNAEPAADSLVPQYPIESVDNALKLLLLLGDQPQIRLSEATRYLGVASPCCVLPKAIPAEWVTGSTFTCRVRMRRCFWCTGTMCDDKSAVARRPSRRRAPTDAGDPAAISERLVLGTATTLGLDVWLPWHTTRTPVSAAADALVGCSDCWAELTGKPASPTYFGAVDRLIDGSLARAERMLTDRS